VLVLNAADAAVRAFVDELCRRLEAAPSRPYFNNGAAKDEEGGEGGGKEGNKKGPTGKLTGANSALPIWTRFMKTALEGEPPLVFPLSPNLKTARIDRFTGKRAEEDCPDPQVLVTLLSPSREPSAESCELHWPPSTRETTAP
jgi:membrane peptidoglycan carboxypeptidase